MPDNDIVTTEDGHMKSVGVLLSALAVASVLGQEPPSYPTDPAKWVQVPTPARKSEEYEAFYAEGQVSFNKWVVSTADGRVVVKQERDAPPPRPAFRVTPLEDALYGRD